MYSASKSYSPRLYYLSWALIAYTILIVVWGAWVRISGSGDGCGDHWPLCHGAAIPLGAGEKTWIEVSHRYSTALFGLLVIAQLVAIHARLPRNHAARRWIWLTVTFTISEALIGRFLVKHGLVNDSQSLYRLLVMPLHLLNTSLLLCAQVATAESIRFGLNRPSATRKLPSKQVYAIAAGMIILLTSGAIAALGSHLMPSESLIKGLQHDLHSNSHLAVRLRLLHPLLGLLIPMGLWLVIYNSGPLTRSSVIHSSLRRQLTFTLALTVVIGVLTLGFLAPVWLKLSHLTVANLLVIMAARYAYHSSPAPLHSEALHSGTPEHLTEGES